ncbi:MAG TPA: kelch repeat-containing protein [Candidatus Limnocylindrales bacterium]|nr:kelch repeat-containing protein [Candidatus Limnocylindrales bacterium]
MTDRELERRLRDWYAAVDGIDGAPADLRESLAAIPASIPAAAPRAGRRRGLTLLAVAAVLVVGGALAAGSGLLTPKPVVTPPPNVAVVVPSGEPTPSEPSSPIPTVPAARSGESIAFIRIVPRKRSCFRSTGGTCPTARAWVVSADGGGGHELVPDGVTNQSDLAWSPDGTRLIYSDDGRLFVADLAGGTPHAADTGCAAPCFADSQPAFSPDGQMLVFGRGSQDSSLIATMELATGRVSELRATGPDGGASPRWSPDGRQIVFGRFGEKDSGGPVPPKLSAVWIVDADGQNLRQVSPTTLAAESPAWSPDGAHILFLSPDGDGQDVYTMRPDGTDVSQLTSDGSVVSAGWTPDGRILFVRTSGWWTVDADGSNAALIVATKALVAAAGDIDQTRPTWQPLGGSAIVPPPWTAATAIAVGPPAPTPSPTAVPSLAPGFAWTGVAGSAGGSPVGQTATLLEDGRVLFAGSCDTGAQLYDPATGAFLPTGHMTAARAGSAATRLADGRVLLTGGSGCGADSENVLATAEVFDPASGTFSLTGTMRTPRESHTSTLLADGRVLITGGMTGPSGSSGVTLAAFRFAETSGNVLKTAEIYDPATGTFTKTGSMSTIRDQHTATLLEDGRVLVLGGGGEGYAPVAFGDLYDPATGTFSKTGSMKVPRWLQVATLLNDGRVLVTGGRSPNDSVYASAEIFDPAAGRFSSTDTMDDGRQQHTATLLQDGRVLVAGGYWSNGQNWRVLASTEVYDPSTGKFGPAGSMGTPREGHTATLLDDGRVLIAGGDDIGNRGAVPITSAVLYQP